MKFGLNIFDWPTVNHFGVYRLHSYIFAYTRHDNSVYNNNNNNNKIFIPFLIANIA